MNQALQNLPDISFIDNMTVEDVLNQLIKSYDEKMSELKGTEVHLARASKERIILNAVAVIIFQGLQYVDRAGKQNLLKYSYDDFLDNVAALKGVKREVAKASTVKVRFSLSEPRGDTTGIPIGTRVSADGDTYFETTEYTEIAAGSLYVDIDMRCTEPGSNGNKFDIGELNVLVDPVNYISSVTNVTVASGGTDIEDDESLRERIYLAPSAYSVAGPEDAYIYWAKTFSNDIADVKVFTEEDSAVVNLCFLLSDGVIPDNTMVSKLEEFLQDENIRPLTDHVVVQAPVAERYNIELSYYINKSNRAQAVSIQNAVNAAIEEYKLWQSTALGRDINPSKLTEMLMRAGAKRVTITSPTYSVLSDLNVAQCGSVTVTYGGIEND